MFAIKYELKNVVLSILLIAVNNIAEAEVDVIMFKIVQSHFHKRSQLEADNGQFAC